jgi:Tfp pilus assembly protein PilO
VTAEEEKQQRPLDDTWHLDKRVPVSIIVTLLIYGFSGLFFIADIKKDVEILKVQQQTQSSVDDRQDRMVADALHQLRESVKEGNAKLDRLIERGNGSTPSGKH